MEWKLFLINEHNSIINLIYILLFLFHCRFLFNSDSSDYWSLSMNANITNESSLCLFDNMQMTRHESKLYYPFSISKKLSYACSALYYNNFTQNLTNTTSDCSPGSMISVVFKNLQVSIVC